LVRGCGHYESWCQLYEVHRTITRGADSEELEELEGDWKRRREFPEPVLFWPYMVAPTCREMDLKTLPDLQEHLKDCTT
jgi:hypothetical protein